VPPTTQHVSHPHSWCSALPHSLPQVLVSPLSVPTITYTRRAGSLIGSSQRSSRALVTPLVVEAAAATKAALLEQGQRGWGRGASQAGMMR
jgi:hypothetical protein